MNKSTREIQKLNRASKKAKSNDVFAIHTQHAAHGKKHAVTVTRSQHSGFAFMEPAEAVASARQRGIRSRFTQAKREKN